MKEKLNQSKLNSQEIGLSTFQQINVNKSNVSLENGQTVFVVKKYRKKVFF